MGVYVDSVIGKDEQVLHHAQISMASYWAVWFIGGLFLFSGLINVVIGLFAESALAGPGFIILLIGGLFIAIPLIAKHTTELVMTNRRIIAKFGLVSRNTFELNLSKIESIRVEQGILGRILNYGDVFVIGTGGSKEPITRISHPLEFRRRYDEILEKNEASKS